MSEAPEQPLPLSLLAANRARFNALFYEPTSVALQTKTNLHLHILKISNGDFDLTGLYRELKGNSVAYVLSRLNYQKVLDDPSLIMEVASKVQSQFRKPDDLAGEGGEVILYSLLEGYLEAPKILSKMELKTSPKHYVYGSDGVHLLRINDDTYQLIFGESKMYGDSGKVGSSARLGIQAALKSVGKVHDEGFNFDTWLVQSELLKEAVDQGTLDTLAAILLPPADGSESSVKKHNAFGIFVGYEIDVTDLKYEDMTLEGIEHELKRRATDAIEAEHDLIKAEIVNRGLGVYPFHIYALPFAKRNVGGEVRGLNRIRFDLAAELGNRKVSE